MWYDDSGAVARFEAKIDKRGKCWLWTAATAGAGYGTFRLSNPRRYVYAHRLALERKLGRALRPKEYALHSCDVPRCVHPDHLRSGDQSDNMQECSERGRTARGERSATARLTEQDVREIRALLDVPGRRMQDIADRYGVSRPAVSNIHSGKTWGYLS